MFELTIFAASRNVSEILNFYIVKQLNTQKMKKINLSEIGRKITFSFLDYPLYVILIYGSIIFLLISIFWAQEFRIESIPAIANIFAVLILSFFLGCIAWGVSILSIIIFAVIWIFGYLLIAGRNLRFYWNRTFSPFSDKDFAEMNATWKD